MRLWLGAGRMPIVREYAMQSIFVAAHSVVIVAGSMMTAVALRTRGYPDKDRDWPMLPVFVREWGLVFIFIPAAWVLLTIWLERHRDLGKRWTILSGILLLAVLACLMMYAFRGADRA